MYYALMALLVLVTLFLLAACSQNPAKTTKQDGERSDTVHVEFINGSDHTVIAVSDVPLTQLPETFRINTSLDMAGKKWSVMSAEPSDKADFARSGKLRVVLAKVTMMPPGDLLFSLPTISDDCGQAVGDTLPNDGLFQIHEDDWRQIEFVSLEQMNLVDQELVDIRNIYATQRSGMGFKNVHVRKRIPTPLHGTHLSLDELRRYFPPKSEFKAVSFDRTAGTIPNSFAWATTSGPVVWGVATDDGIVSMLCFVPSRCEIDALVIGLAKMTREKRLLLIDWCRATSITGDEQAFRAYLSPEKK